MVDKYYELEQSEIDWEWELIKPDDCRLSKEEEIACMNIAKRKGWSDFNVYIRKGKVYITERNILYTDHGCKWSRLTRREQDHYRSFRGGETERKHKGQWVKCDSYEPKWLYDEYETDMFVRIVR